MNKCACEFGMTLGSIPRLADLFAMGMVDVECFPVESTSEGRPEDGVHVRAVFVDRAHAKNFYDEVWLPACEGTGFTEDEKDFEDGFNPGEVVEDDVLVPVSAILGAIFNNFPLSDERIEMIATDLTGNGHDEAATAVREVWERLRNI